MRQRGARWRPDRMGDGRGRRPSAIWLIQLANASEASRLVRRHEERLCRKAETALYYLAKGTQLCREAERWGKDSLQLVVPVACPVDGVKNGAWGQSRPAQKQAPTCNALVCGGSFRAPQLHSPEQGTRHCVGARL